MDDRTLRVLEFYRLLDVMKEFSISPLGRRRVERLRPTTELPAILTRLSEVIELKEILERSGDLPLRGLKDIEEILRKLDVEGAVLEVKDLLDIYANIQLCKGLKRFFLRFEPYNVSNLWQKVSRFSYLKNLEKDILWAIDKRGEILDHASPKLSEVRDQIKKIRNRINHVLEHILLRDDLSHIFQDRFITIRNGRYVLPVKSDYKNVLEGIIHDQSQSGMTIFLEPLEVISLNNDMNILSAEEKAEEYRILKDLSDKVRYEKEKLWGDFEILGELDMLYAMARLTIVLQGIKPIIDDSGNIDIKGARNPILLLQKEKEVVPIDLKIGNEKKVLIISGANAGGKTVALKTMGLLCLMVQSGLPIPVSDGSRMTIFDQIYAVIGDEQDIEENLSTFSSHLIHVNEILEKSGNRSLILIDELGVGTNAREGCALAMGFLDQFREKGALIVIITHFDNLKIYGYLHKDVENAAVEFDEKTLEPKYKLYYGYSGLSNAFLVAERLGISKKVIDLSKKYADGGDSELSERLKILEELKRKIEVERLELLQLKEEVSLERKRLKEILEGIRDKRKEIILKAEEKAKLILKQLEQEVGNWVRLKREEIKNSNERLKSLYAYKKEIKEIKEKFFPSIKHNEFRKIEGNLHIGENVKIEALKSTGILTKVDKNSDKVEILTDRIKVKAPISQIIKVEGVEGEIDRFNQKGFSTLNIDSDEAPSRLNVIGLRVEDALPEIDKFIDRAILHGLEKIYVIHGIGSGRLRSAIAGFLSDHPGVKQFSSADKTEGGHGVTVIELR